MKRVATILGAGCESEMVKTNESGVSADLVILAICFVNFTRQDEIEIFLHELAYYCIILELWNLLCFSDLFESESWRILFEDFDLIEDPFSSCDACCGKVLCWSYFPSFLCHFCY
jgi:hypothetical protein